MKNGTGKYVIDGPFGYGLVSLARHALAAAERALLGPRVHRQTAMIDAREALAEPEEVLVGPEREGERRLVPGGSAVRARRSAMVTFGPASVTSMTIDPAPPSSSNDALVSVRASELAGGADASTASRR